MTDKQDMPSIIIPADWHHQVEAAVKECERLRAASRTVLENIFDHPDLVRRFPGTKINTHRSTKS